MKRWLLIPAVGAGTDGDPIRPDLPADIGYSWTPMANGSQCLVHVTASETRLDEIADRPRVAGVASPAAVAMQTVADRVSDMDTSFVSSG